MEVVKITNDTKKDNIIGVDGSVVIDPNIPKEMQEVILGSSALEAISSTTNVIDREEVKKAPDELTIKKVHGPSEADKIDGVVATSVPLTD